MKTNNITLYFPTVVKKNIWFMINRNGLNRQLYVVNKHSLRETVLLSYTYLRSVTDILWNLTVKEKKDILNTLWEVKQPDLLYVCFVGTFNVVRSSLRSL